jgi:hypothetical protein
VRVVAWPVTRGGATDTQRMEMERGRRHSLHLSVTQSSCLLCRDNQSPAVTIIIEVKWAPSFRWPLQHRAGLWRSDERPVTSTTTKIAM